MAARKSSKATRLDRDAWVKAGLRALADGGVETVNVEGLARTLGATKGSFYWHFANREALLTAVHEEWERVTTDAVKQATEAHGGSGRERLAYLIGLCTDGRVDRLESALRAWAATSASVGAAAARVDRKRQTYMAALLRAEGLQPALAAQRAHLLYLALVGNFTWNAHAGRKTTPAAWKDFAQLLLQR